MEGRGAPWTQPASQSGGVSGSGHGNPETAVCVGSPNTPCPLHDSDVDGLFVFSSQPIQGHFSACCLRVKIGGFSSLLRL